jgi:hypothetical protein
VGGYEQKMRPFKWKTDLIRIIVTITDKVYFMLHYDVSRYFKEVKENVSIYNLHTALVYIYAPTSVRNSKLFPIGPKDPQQ